MRYLIYSAQLRVSTYETEQRMLGPYERFCAREGASPWPVDGQAFARFLGEHASTVTEKTLKLRVAAIRRRHLDNGWEDPLANGLMRACYRVALRRCPERSTPILHGRELAEFLDRIARDAIGIRDIAILLLVYCTRIGCRALSSLNRSDIHIAGDGMRIKTTYHGIRKTITIRRHADARYCAVAAMERYMRLLSDEELQLFRATNGHGSLMARRLGAIRVKYVLRERLLPPGTKTPVGLHSLHASAVIAAVNRGASDYRVMRQLGYHGASSVRRWKARCGFSANNLTEKLGL